MLGDSGLGKIKGAIIKPIVGKNTWDRLVLDVALAKDIRFHAPCAKPSAKHWHSIQDKNAL
jgi:hypothetical protein